MCVTTRLWCVAMHNTDHEPEGLDPLVRLSKAAELLGPDVPARPLYDAHRDGRLRTTVRIGRHIYVRRSELERIRDHGLEVTA